MIRRNPHGDLPVVRESVDPAAILRGKAVVEANVAQANHGLAKGHKRSRNAF